MNKSEEFFLVFGFVVGVAVSILIYDYLLEHNQEVEPVSELSIDYDTYGGVWGTGSMLPSIEQDDTILYQSEDFNIEIGDIYVYVNRETGEHIIHRLIYMDNETCLFKGDNNPYVDNPVNCEDIIRKVVGIIEVEASVRR